MNVSVAMTTYNGEKYIKEQLDSILGQLNSSDEIIISDDGSGDSTIKIVTQYANEDKRVKVFKNNKLGIVENFEFAIKKCNNDIIILSDQDDIWMPSKVEMIKKHFIEKSKILVLHNAIKFRKDNEMNEGILIKKKYDGVVRNILTSSYWGCCMAFSQELKKVALPFPKKLVAHDQWIGLNAELYGTVIYINEPLIYHRMHKHNATKRLSLWGKVAFRLNLSYLFIGRILNHSFLEKKND